MSAILPECYNEVFSFCGVGQSVFEAVEDATANAREHFGDPAFQNVSQHPASVCSQLAYDVNNGVWHYIITIVRTVNA